MLTAKPVKSPPYKWRCGKQPLTPNKVEIQLAPFRGYDQRAGMWHQTKTAVRNKDGQKRLQTTRCDVARPAVGCVGWPGCAADSDTEDNSSFSWASF